MNYTKICLILGNCLFKDHNLLKANNHTIFLLLEDYGLCTHFRYHKHKLVLFLSAMRAHASYLSKNHSVHYEKLTRNNKDLSYEDKLGAFLDKHPSVKTITTYTIEDHFFADRITAFCRKRKVVLEIIESPAFLTSHKEFGEYLRSVKTPFMHTFYQRQRKRLGILLDPDNKPVHGKWSFDAENRKKLPKGIVIPALPKNKETQDVKEVKKLVDDLFASHPGSTENFNWATTYAEVQKCIRVFLNERFTEFGPYEDAIHSNYTFLFHSVLSPYINMGLITPDQIIDEVLSFSVENNTHFPSVEGYVRQVIGWREFIRGIYHAYDEKLQKNFFGHTRKMKECWYSGTTGIVPLDDAIRKVNEHAYTHHIERLMVLGNIMLLCEIHPDQVYKWFMEMYIDSSDWVMVPNVYGMSQFADGGIFATKPYIGGSAYILKMSNYPKKGEWPEIVNGLYWRFISVNRPVFEENNRMRMMTGLLDKMDKEKKDKLLGKAEEFIEKVTE